MGPDQSPWAISTNIHTAEDKLTSNYGTSTPSAPVSGINGAYPSLSTHQGESRQSTNLDDDDELAKESVVRSFLAIKGILFYSVINVLLIFVPVGMAVRKCRCQYHIPSY